MTRCRAWPNQAEWARQDAIALSIRGRTALKSVIELTHTTRTTVAIFEATEAFREIENILKQIRKGDKDD
jgi:hypothetical protein